MRPVDQTILGRGPDHGEPAGNCMQAAMASVLELRLDQVPHFLVDGGKDGWAERCDAWLRERGLMLLTTSWEPLEPGIVVPACYHLAVGLSPRDSSHVVVCYAERVAHDPHPSRAGLVTVKYREFFVCLDPERSST